MPYAPGNGGAENAIQAIEAQHCNRLQSLPAHIAVVDSAGSIKFVNPSWQAFANANGGRGEAYLGESYLDICEKSAATDADAGAAFEGLSAVLSGDLPEFTMEYPCHSPSEQRWFRMDVTSLDLKQRSGLIVSHMDITQLKVQQLALQDIAGSVRSALAEIDFDVNREKSPELKTRAAFPRGEMSNLLGETVAEAHYLAARLLAFAKRKDYCAREETEFAATMINQWALVVGTNLFEGKKFFKDDSDS